MLVEEKVGGKPVHPNAVQDLANCMYAAELVDLKHKGCRLTWSNKCSGEGRRKCKLDRVLINQSWISSYPDSEADFLNPGTSDHSPMMVHFYAEGPEHFRFSTFMGCSRLSCLRFGMWTLEETDV